MSRTVRAEWATTCDHCGREIRIGDLIVDVRGRWVHRACWEADHE